MTRSLWAFVAWTLFLWATRIRNVVQDDELSTGAAGLAGAIAVVFLLASISLPVLAARRRDLLGRAVRVVMTATILWWAMRLVTNLVGDGSVGFKAVHTILAVLTIALASAILAAPIADRSAQLPLREANTT